MTTTTLLPHLVADYSSPPPFVERTYGEPLFQTDSEVLGLAYAADDTRDRSLSEASVPQAGGVLVQLDPHAI